MAFVRAIAGIAGGMIAAVVTIAIVETLGHSMLAGEALFGAVACGYGLGAFTGTWVASRIAGARLSLCVPIMLAVLAAINLMALVHPWWFAPAAAALLALGWLAGRRVGRSQTLWQSGRIS